MPPIPNTRNGLYGLNWSPLNNLNPGPGANVKIYSPQTPSNGPREEFYFNNLKTRKPSRMQVLSSDIFLIPTNFLDKYLVTHKEAEVCSFHSVD